MSQSAALVKQLSKYATYHRDKRNIFTHFFGVPMIVLGVMVLLARPQVPVAGWLLSPMCVGLVISILYYLRLEITMGLIMAAQFVLMALAAQTIAASSTATWLAAGIGLFVVGWVIQFIGHYYEGKKPAFVDDLIGLMIGPMFVTAELLFLLGLRKGLEHEIEAIAGPALIRERAVVA